MQSLQDKVCIVTGGASGFGREVVHQLLSEGAIPVIFDLQVDGIESNFDVSKVFVVKCDVTDEEQVRRSINEVVLKFKKIDVLVNNVGILVSAPLVAFVPGGLKLHDTALWHKVLTTNLTSAFYMAKYSVDVMIRNRTKGVIVNISSISARGNAGQSAYAAAKAGLESLTRVWSKELPALGIRCFGIAPGFCDTPSTHTAMSAAVLKETINRVPVRRLGDAGEIASFVIVGLKNEFLNGKILEIDGGLVV